MKRILAFLSSCLLFFYSTAFAQAPALTDVTTGQHSPGGTTNWWMWLAILVVIAAVAYFVWARKNSPTQATQISIDFNNAILALLVEFKKIAASIEGKVIVTSVPGTPAEPPVVVEHVIVGKYGLPGAFVMSVTGDPAIDIAAFNAQYFAK